MLQLLLQNAEVVTKCGSCYKMARDTRFSFEIRKNNALKGTNLFTKFNLFTVMRKEVHVFISLKITETRILTLQSPFATFD